MILGGVSSFVISDQGVEQAGGASEVPAGVLHQVEPVLLSKKMWENNWVVMMSDGVLDALPGEDKEGMLKEFLESIPRRTPQDMAHRILEFAASFFLKRHEMT